jgi:hypothetical protein
MGPKVFRSFRSSFQCAYDVILLGFPPPDNDLRGWFLSIVDRNDPDKVQWKLHGFITSLLKVTLDRLQKLTGNEIVLAF